MPITRPLIPVVPGKKRNTAIRYGRTILPYRGIGKNKSTRQMVLTGAWDILDGMKDPAQSLGMVLPLPTDIAYGGFSTACTYAFTSFWKKFMVLTSFFQVEE